MFAHYRPVGDPDWFKKVNPPDAPKPLLDIGACEIVNDGLSPPKCSGNHNLTFLSPKLYKLESFEDLFKYWKAVAEDSSLNPPEGEIDNSIENESPIFGLDEDEEEEDDDEEEEEDDDDDNNNDLDQSQLYEYEDLADEL